MEGIVMKTVPYRDRDRVVTLFTEEGLISVMMYRPKAGLAEMLTVGEYEVEKGKGELWKLKDGYVIRGQRQLCKTIPEMDVAGKMIQAILRTQMPEKATPGLYPFFRAYLSQVCGFKNLPNLLYSFYLKLLKHEGLLSAQEVAEYAPLSTARTFKELVRAGTRGTSSSGAIATLFTTRTS